MTTDTLGDAFPREIERVKQIRDDLRNPLLRGAGELAARLADLDIRLAEKAWREMDTVAMIRLYPKLKEWKS